MGPLELFERGLMPATFPLPADFGIPLNTAVLEAKKAAESGLTYEADKPAVFDNCLWVSCESVLPDGSWDGKSPVWSGKDEVATRWTKKGKVVQFKISVNGLDAFNTVYLKSLTEYTQPEEEVTMAENENKVPTELENFLKDPSGVPPMPAGEPMNAFNASTAAGATGTEKETRTSIAQDISKRLSAVPTVSADGLTTFNQSHGRLHFYVAATEAKNAIVVGKDYPVDPTSGKKILSEKAQNDPEIADKHAKGQTVKKEHYEFNYVLEAVQQKPGKVLGVAISLPEGGVKSFEDLVGGDVKFNRERTNLVHELYSLNEGKFLIHRLFGGSIYEDENVVGVSSADGKKYVTTVVGVPSRNTDNKSQSSKGSKVTLRAVTSRTGNTQLLNDKNYFPIKVYKTISLSDNLTEEQEKTLNVSAFHTILKGSSVGRKSGQTSEKKYDKLSPDYRAKVQEVNGVITSVYFNRDISKREGLAIKPFYAAKSAAPIALVSFPVKKFVQPKTPGGDLMLRYETFDATSPKVDLNDTAFGRPEYKRLVDAFPNLLTPERLRQLNNKSRGGAAKYMDQADVDRLLIGYFTDTVKSSEIELERGADVKQLNQRLVRMASAL